MNKVRGDLYDDGDVQSHCHLHCVHKLICWHTNLTRVQVMKRLQVAFDDSDFCLSSQDG